MVVSVPVRRPGRVSNHAAIVFIVVDEALSAALRAFPRRHPQAIF
jgi:hypothetical protein